MQRRLIRKQNQFADDFATCILAASIEWPGGCTARQSRRIRTLTNTVGIQDSVLQVVTMRATRERPQRLDGDFLSPLLDEVSGLFQF